MSATNRGFAQAFPTWQTAGSGSTTSWNNSGNWNGGPVTSYGQLQWTGNGNATSDDDLTSDLSQNRLYFSGTKAYTLTDSGGHAVNLFDFNNNFAWVLSDSTANQTINPTINFAATSSTAATYGQISTRNSGNLIFSNIGITGSHVSQLRFADTTDFGGPATITVNGGVSGSSKDVLIGLTDAGNDAANTNVTFNGTNTYSGVTYIVAGKLSLGASSTLSTSSIQLGQTGGSAAATLSLLGAAGQSFSTPITIRAGSSGTKTITSAANGTGTASTLSAAVTVNDNFSVTSASGGNLIFSGAVSNATTAETMTLNGAGTVTLQGSSDNSFLQANVSSGTLVLNKASDSAHHALGGNTETVSGGTLQLSGSNGDQIQDGASVIVSSGAFDLNGQSETINSMSLNGTGINSHGALTNSNATTASTLTLNTASSLAGATSIGGTSDITISGAGKITGQSGGTTLTKVDNNKLTLSNGAGVDNTDLLLQVNAGTVVLNKTGTSVGGAHTVGSVIINSGGTVQLGGSGNGEIYEGLATNAVNSGGVLDLNGQSQTFTGSGLLTINGTGISSGGALVNSNASTASTLTGPVTLGSDSSVGGSGNLTISGMISGSGKALAKVGAGTLTLTANNTYTGATTVAGGTLKPANGSGVALSGTSSVAINNGGTLLMGANNQINQATFPGIGLGSVSGGGTAKLDAGGFSQGTGGNGLPNSGTIGLGALTLNASSVIDLTGTSVLHFSNSSAKTWTGTLSIWDWSGTPVTGGGAEQILFGGDSTGLSATQLLTQIQFYSGAGTGAYTMGAVILADGEIVPIPEPSTWIGGALVFGTLLITQRRRLTRRCGNGG